jgi:hypothetical protein
MLMLDTGVELPLGLSYLIPRLTNEGENFGTWLKHQSNWHLSTPLHTSTSQITYIANNETQYFPFEDSPAMLLLETGGCILSIKVIIFGTQCANHYLEFGKF